MAGIEQTKTYGVSYTLTADGRSLNEALTTAVTAARDLSANLADAHVKMQTLMSGKGVTDVVNNFSKFYKDQLDKQKKGVSNILDEQAKRLQNINAKINVLGNFAGKVEALNSVARSLSRIKTLYDKTGGVVNFNVNVQIGKSQTQLESLRRKAESVRTAIQKPIKIDVQTGAGRTQLGQAVKNLKSWTAELKNMGSALASQAGDKAIPVNVKPQVSPNTPPLQTSAMVTEIMNNLKTSAGTVGVEGIVNFVKAAEAVAGEIGGLSGIISFVKAAKTVVGEVGGLSGIIESVKGAKSVIGEVGGLSGIISNVKAAQSVVGEISGLTGTITSVQNAAEKILSINVEGIVNSVKTGTKTEALPLEAKLNTANINEQIKAFKPNPIAVNVQLGWGAKENSQASQIKKMSESLKPLPMSVDLDISKAKAKLEELRTFAASMSPLNVGTTMTGPANKGTTQSAVQSQVQRATVASIRATSGSRSRITYDDQTGWPTRRGGFYTDLRKNLYPFTGNTSFGARTPMALDMAKGMGMMFAVSGVMQAVTGSFNQVSEYENLMKTVQAILKTNDGGGDFSGRFKAMENEIRRVGRTTKFTAPEVAGAARFMAMAGLGIEDINAATNPIANLALVGDNDMSTTADKMTNIMTSFGLLKGLSTSQKKTNMRHTSDVLTNTFTRSNTDLIQLAEAMQYAGPMSHLTGTSLEDAAAMVGVMGNAGIQSSMAGTTLRMMYQNIIKPNKKQAAEWDRLGIKRTDEQGRVRNIFDILQDLRAKITGTTDLNAKVGPDQLKIMGAEVMSLFRTTAGAGTAALLENLGEAISLAQSNREANGVAQTIADEKKNTIAGLWAQVTSTFTDQSVDTVTEFQESIKEMLRNLRDWLASKEAAETLKNIYSMAREVLDVLGWVAGIWKDIYSFAPGIINTFIKFQFLATQIGFLATPFVQIVGTLSVLKNGLIALGKALGFSASAAVTAASVTKTAATSNTIATTTYGTTSAAAAGLHMFGPLARYGGTRTSTAGLPLYGPLVPQGTSGMSAGGRMLSLVGPATMLGLPFYPSRPNIRNPFRNPISPIGSAFIGGRSKVPLGLPYYPGTPAVIKPSTPRMPLGLPFMGLPAVISSAQGHKSLGGTYISGGFNGGTGNSAWNNRWAGTWHTAQIVRQSVFASMFSRIGASMRGMWSSLTGALSKGVSSIRSTFGRLFSFGRGTAGGNGIINGLMAASMMPFGGLSRIFTGGSRSATNRLALPLISGLSTSATGLMSRTSTVWSKMRTAMFGALPFMGSLATRMGGTSGARIRGFLGTPALGGTYVSGSAKPGTGNSVWNSFWSGSWNMANMARQATQASLFTRIGASISGMWASLKGSISKGISSLGSALSKMFRFGSSAGGGRTNRIVSGLMMASMAPFGGLSRMFTRSSAASGGMLGLPLFGGLSTTQNAVKPKLLNMFGPLVAAGTSVAVPAMTKAAAAMGAATNAMGGAASMWKRFTTSILGAMPFLSSIGGRMKGIAMGAGTAIGGIFRGFPSGPYRFMGTSSKYGMGATPSWAGNLGYASLGLLSGASFGSRRFNQITNPDILYRANNIAFKSGRIGWGRAGTNALYAGMMAGQFANWKNIGIVSLFTGILKSTFTLLAKAFGLLLSPVGLLTTAFVAVGAVVWKFVDAVKQHNEQLNTANKVIENFNNRQADLKSRGITDSEQLGGPKAISVGYNNLDTPVSDLSLSGNKDVESILGAKNLTVTEMFDKYVKNSFGKFLAPELINSFLANNPNTVTENWVSSTGQTYQRTTNTFNQAGFKKAQSMAIAGAWAEQAINSEDVQKAATDLRIAMFNKDVQLQKDILNKYKADSKAPHMIGMDPEVLSKVSDPRKYFEINDAISRYLTNISNSVMPVIQFNEALKMLEPYTNNIVNGKNIGLLNEGNTTKKMDIARNLMGGQALVYNDKKVQLTFDKLGNVDWKQFAKDIGADKVSAAERQKIINNLYDGLRNNEGINSIPGIVDLLKTFLPKIAGLPGIYIKPGDEVKMGDRINREDWKEAAKDWFENSGEYKGNKSFDKFFKDGVWMQKTPINTISKYYLKRQEEANKVNDKNGITPPSTDQSAYDSKYNRHQARPTQIIFNIDQLCKFENTQVNSADQKSIAETVGRQLSEGLQILFAQAASDFAIVGEANG